MTWRQLRQRIERDGWKLDRIKGSHGQFYHPDSCQRITLVLNHQGADVPPNIERHTRRALSSVKKTSG